MEIFKLFGSVLIDSKDAENSISKTEKKAGGLGTTLGNGIKTAAKWGAAIAAGAAVAIGGMAKLVSGALDVTSEITKFSQVTGHSTDAYQRWDTVMKNVGYSMEQANGDLAALGEKAMDAANGAGEGAELFGLLGVTVTDTSGKLKSQEQIFQETITALQGMEDVTERNAIASALLSTTGEELVPILNMTNEELANMKANANVISEEDLAKAAKFKESWDQAKNTLSTVVTEIGINLMPMFQGLLDWISGNMPLIQSTAESAFKAIGDAITKVSDFINNSVMPALSDFWVWLEPNLPLIKEAFETAFGAIEEAIVLVVDAVKDVTTWIQDHWAILEPILIGIAAGALAYQVITTGIALYRGALLLATAAQLAMNGAMALNPIGLVVIAIGLLVAAGVLLYKNWDVIVAKVKELFTAIKTKFNEIKTAVVDKVSEIKTAISTKFGEIKSAAVTKFNEVKNAILDPINTAKDKVKEVVDTIKGFFTGMKLNLPSIKVPEFSLRNWSINPLDWIKNMPSIGVNWNAQGALFTKPTIFNTPMGLQGFGEDGAEAAIPLNDKVLGKIGQMIASTMESRQETNYNAPLVQVANMTVRDDKDVRDISSELYNLQRNADRQRGR